MNLFKISIKNIRKSWKDYSVYFMTLIIGVAIFYMFNSLASQGMMANISESGYAIVKLMGNVIQGMSIGVSIVLGLLIVYANNFLIKRRKKEFGIYRMLGMGKNKVSAIILGETVIVGIISLAVGIVLGVFGSQFLSILVVKMFEADVTKYAFSISKDSIIKTLINFVVIFIVVSIFNTATVAKYQLIKLLNADKMGEKKLIKNPVVSAIITAISIVMLGYAYYRVGFCVKDLDQKSTLIYILMGVVATFLFFIGLAGFLLEVLKRAKGTYYKGLNSFVLRQFCTNINSSAFSMAVISLMLFFSISAFSAGFSIKNSLNESLRKYTPVDITIYDSTGSATENMQARGLETDKVFKDGYVEIPLYKHEDITFTTIVGSMYEIAASENRYVLWDTKESVIKLSDYNRVARLYGEDELKLEPDTYAELCNFVTFADYKNASFEKGERLSVNGKELSNGPGKCIDGFLQLSGLSSNTGIVIVPDELIDDASMNFIYDGTFFAANYVERSKEKRLELDKMVVENIGILGEFRYIDGEYTEPPVQYELSNEIRENSNGLSVLVVFIVLYMGIVFIISSAAILALKNLSDSIDAVKKYEILGKIGADKGMMRRALFSHVALTFGLPIALAIIDTVFGLMFAKNILTSYFLGNMFNGIVTTAVIMIVIYGGYMLTTYLGSLRIVNFD